MFKGKFIALSLIAAALLSWQVMGVGSVSSGIVDPCSSTATSAGGCWMICPQGDGVLLSSIRATISVTIKDNTGAPIGGILFSDFWVIGCNDEIVLCGGSGAMGADSATNAAGQTTLSGTLDGSGCAIPTASGISVVCQGTIIANPANCALNLCLPIRTVSPDCAPAVRDLTVDVVDFAAFGAAFPTPSKPYQNCKDFNCDGAVDLIDFARFGQHWLHSC
jgi:hypothetical protein